MTTDRGRFRLGAILVAVASASTGCYEQQMADQARLDPLEASELFADGRASRAPIRGTVPRGGLRADAHLYEGVQNGQPATEFPFEVTLDVLSRGRERYDIFCAPCHDRVGNGNGIVVQRGFRRPTSLHVDRLREAPAGYFYDVISNGFGAMSSYASQVPVRDRWAIIAYVRALQLSQSAPRDALGPDDIERLGGAR